MVVAILFLIGLIGSMETDGLLTGLLAGLLLGFVFGIGFVVYGQLVSVFLGQKEVLEELLELQRRAAAP